jgi:glycosyltransferase involved in cell wall biosynthesis
MRLVFWHPCLSIHHAPLMRRLSLMPDTQVSLVARRGLENGREANGWSIPDYGDTELIDTTGTDRHELIQRIVSKNDGDTLHLVSDAIFNPISRAAWQYCTKIGVPFGFISICPGMYVGRIGRLLRHVLYRTYVRQAARAVNPILTISEQCRQFFLQNGFHAERIYPWAYFVENRAQPITSRESSVLRLLYLGRLIQRKRVDLLLRAISQLKIHHSAIALTIIGDGPESENLKKLARDLALTNLITFAPPLPHECVHEAMQKHDVLVLPTECDDWGVVINEALQSGLAVITTENAGACELIENSHAGMVCKSSSSSLSAAIQSMLNPDNLTAMQSRARPYSQYVSPESAAQYLRTIAAHTLYGAPRPVAPWHTRWHAETGNESPQHRLRQCRRSLDDADRIFAADTANHLNAPQ